MKELHLVQQQAVSRIRTEDDLVSACMALIGSGAQLTSAERERVRSTQSFLDFFVDELQREIRFGNDPLGVALSRIRSEEQRRGLGAVYTPQDIVESMLKWAQPYRPERVVDPGAGSGRFTIGAARYFPHSELIAVEIDPLAALVLRANLAVHCLSNRCQVIVADYRDMQWPTILGSTLFIGNPPYIRHHGIPRDRKAWYSSTLARAGLKGSQLAGLHAHFFVKTWELARPGDLGCFITASEFLDVNYGRALRKLLCSALGVESLHLLNPQIMAFAHTLVTAVITCFQVGNTAPLVRYRTISAVAELEALSGGVTVERHCLDREDKWSRVTTKGRSSRSRGMQLGEIFAVHRGQVTGANHVWIVGNYPKPLPNFLSFPTVTRAKELFAAGKLLHTDIHLKRVIDLPPSLDALPIDQRRLVEEFLEWATVRGARDSYIARHRSPWWSVKLREPAPILCTYMARRAPVFIRNVCGARHINIAHGLYPRQPLPDAVLDVIIGYLSTSVSTADGRTYAGGLTKFEPRELERLWLPRLEELYARAEEVDSGGVGIRRSARN